MKTTKLDLTTETKKTGAITETEKIAFQTLEEMAITGRIPEDSPEWLEKAVLAVRDVLTNCRLRFNCDIKVVNSGKQEYLLSTLNDETIYSYATEEEASAHAPKDGSWYDIYCMDPYEQYMIVDLDGKSVGDGKLYANRRDAAIAILRQYVSEWSWLIAAIDIDVSDELEESGVEEHYEDAVERYIEGKKWFEKEVGEKNYVYNLIANAESV
ncbi:MAG: hypothetical protein J6B39_07345 [Lachnospiraceae bacterium]|nr:hypothetical protein [Lachnospiraceae bacterium]